MIKFRDARDNMARMLNRYELARMLVPNLVSSATEAAVYGGGWQRFIGSLGVSFTTDLIHALVRAGADGFMNGHLKRMNNADLIRILNKFNYREGRDYTIGDEKSPITVHMNNGILLISMKSGYNKSVVERMSNIGAHVTDLGKLTLISYHPARENYLERDIDVLMKLARKINIYDNE